MIFNTNMFENIINEIAIMGNELTYALLVAVFYGLILSDLKKYFPIENIFSFFRINDLWIKLLIFPLYYIGIVVIGVLGLIFVLFVFALL